MYRRWLHFRLSVDCDCCHGNLMAGLVRRLINIWRLKLELNRNLAARKRLRPLRRQAALKGWQTRRSKT